MRSKIKKFENKVVIITGASSGLGRQLSEDFAINNAKVVLVARSTEKLLKLEKEIQALASDTLVITADITKPGDISKIKDLTLEKFGRIDILVNNAGIEKMARFEDLKPEDIAELTQTNFTGPVTLMNKILPVMLSQQSGHIVNIGSMVTRMPTTFEEVYSGAKLGLRGITETLNFGYKNKGVNFSILEAPGLSGEGIMHRIITKTKVKTPRIFPVVSVHTMSKKVLKAIKKRQVVVLVMPRIMMPRVMGKMLAIFPGLGGFMVKRMGILSFMEHVVDYRLENYDSYTATISS